MSLRYLLRLAFGKRLRLCWPPIRHVSLRGDLIPQNDGVCSDDAVGSHDCPSKNGILHPYECMIVNICNNIHSHPRSHRHIHASCGALDSHCCGAQARCELFRSLSLVLRWNRILCLSSSLENSANPFFDTRRIGKVVVLHRE
jgi:hypothetical protein